MHESTEVREAVMPPGIPGGPAERFAYSYGVRVGQLLHVSGMVSIDSEGTVTGEGDVGAQTRQVFENMRAVLETAGGSLDDVVSTTTYMTDRTFSPAINDVRNEYLSAPVKPTSTLIVVAGLARPEFLVEISAVAVLRSVGPA